MKMMKQRDATEGGFPAIERGVQGIGKFARVGVSERAPSDCGGSGVKILTVRGEKMLPGGFASGSTGGDRKSTRLNSSHSQISYAVFCLKKKKKERMS